MTKQLRNKTVCPHCGHEFDSTTPFSQWIRALPAPLDGSNYDCQNLDYVWNSFRGDGWFITIEEKRYGALSDPRTQGDTHGIVKQMLSLASLSIVYTFRGRRKYEYRGHYVVSFEKTTPVDSAWVKINGTQHEKPIEAVMNLLKTGKSGSIELVSENVISDVRGKEWLESLTYERLWGLVEWIGARGKRLLKDKDKAA